jgi:hypothetical protein
MTINTPAITLIVVPTLPVAAIVGDGVGVSVPPIPPLAIVGVAVGAVVATAPVAVITTEHVALTAPELSVKTEVAVKLPPEL